MGDPKTHKLIAGNVCLDFVNTINGHRNNVFNEYIHSFEDLVIWSTHGGYLSSDQSVFFKKKRAQDEPTSLKVFKKAIAFRESLFDIFFSIVHEKSPPQKALEKLVAIQKKGLQASKLVENNRQFKWIWAFDTSLEAILWPIAFSATKLLTSDDLNKLRICDGAGCDWFFIDKSRNQMRRWCSMDDCGNKYKMRQRYLRQK